MKSALIRVLFFLCAICVFGDADIVSVIEGDSVTLHTDVTEILSSDVIEWKLNGSRIAIISDDVASTEGASRDRLQLDNQTGDLKITNIKTTDSGEYILKIKNSRGSSEKTFSVSVVSGVDEVKSVSVTVGDSVTLNSGTIIQRDDVIEWRFGDLNSLIAEHNRKTGNFSTSDERFRHRLQLDYSTGSLTITNTSTKHSGLYEADIRKSSSLHTIHKSYSVTASGEMTSALSVKKGYSVTLHTDLTEIQTEDFMQWMFGDTVLAEINQAQKRFLIHDGPDGRFRGRLKLDPQTRSLTITDTSYTDSGVYELKISSSRFIINKRITVTVTGEITSVLSVKNGDPVTLHTDLTEIQTDDVMQWMFGDTVIAEINKAQKQSSTSDGPDGRFRGRLKLDNQTGSLNITHTRYTDSGLYELKISSSSFIINKRITVTVTGE
ncbi:hypothetical protein R3I93_016867 [Phoxinus phoxinus]|uniref:Ig-like domain-containing protein n=1 Tax=Phoxinus phoxinus TaxID=58324 RepID=A0AAN9GWZ2_9TELE